MVLLEGEKVSLRPLEPDDKHDIFKATNDPIAAGEFDVFQLTSWAEVEKWFKEEKDPHEFTTLIIEKNQDKSKIGIVVHYLVHPTLRNIEVGFQIWSENDRNKGYATEAVKLIVDYLFSTRFIERIQATTSTENKSTQRVLENCGFLKEGMMRASLFAMGRFHDTIIYSILREEWTSRTQEKTDHPIDSS